MRSKSAVIVLFSFIVILHSNVLMFSCKDGSVSAQNAPILYDEDAYEWDEYVVFEVYYQDPDGDGAQAVYLLIKGDPEDDWYEMYNWEGGEPSTGQMYEYYMENTLVGANTEFYFYAEDVDGDYAQLDDGGYYFVLGNYIGFPSPQLLSDEDANLVGNDVVFKVTYTDPDGDEATVTLVLDDSQMNIMSTQDPDPVSGQRYSVSIASAGLDTDTSFYFMADNSVDEVSYLPDLGDGYFYVGDYVVLDGGSGSPVLSNANARVEGDNVIFEVNYRDPDGDEGFVTLGIQTTTVQVNQMTSQDDDPVLGMHYIVSLPKAALTTDTEFFFMVDNSVDDTVYLPPPDTNNLRLGDYVSATELGGSGDSNIDSGSKDSGSSSRFGAWGEPEVIVGLVALVGMAGAGGYGYYRSQKKRNRFSELLTQVDNVYRSYKLHPHQCEIELEKIRAVISEELKHSVIDENNYSILKERIDELMSDIRSETLLSEVRDVPKDIEIRIKDMLIDGKITREEYDKLLPIITGSDMASQDKEKMQKVVESWVKEDNAK